MSYLSASTHAALTASGGQTMPNLYASVRQTFINDAPFLAGLPEPLIGAAFASVVAFDHAPYGSNTSMTLQGLLSAPTLNCDDYCVLTSMLSDILNLSGPTLQIALSGWNGGAIGNHAQILASCDGKKLLLDPTIGFIAKDISLAGLCRGYPPNANSYRSFFPFQSSRTDVAPFDVKVRNAVLGGKYMASDILYFFPDHQSYLASSGSSTWATPQSWNI